MGVAIRKSALKNNRSRLSLDIYYKGKSKYENLELFVYDKPTSIPEREHNKRTWMLAESIQAKRVLEMQENKYNFNAGAKKKGSFIQYFKRLTDERRRSTDGNYGNWYSTYKHLLNFSKGKNLTFEDFDDQLLGKFREYLLHGRVTKGNQNLSNASASSYLNKIKAALRQAHDENIITVNPGRRVKGIPVPEGERQYLLLEELKLLSSHPCRIPIIKQAFLFSCLTGLRWSDVNKLLWEEVVYSEQEGKWKIHFRQKKTKGLQYHPISDQAYSILGKRGEDKERVFKGLKYSAWNNFILAEWVILAGVKKHITFHSARHTYATLLLTQGADIFSVSKLLGHKHLATTQIYGKIIDSKRNSIIELLPDIGV